jgi:hypothetical protein
MILRRGVVSTSPKLKAGGPPPLGSPQLLIQFIRIYIPYLEEQQCKLVKITDVSEIICVPIIRIKSLLGPGWSLKRRLCFN